VNSIVNGRMQIIPFMAQATVAKRVLDHLGLDSTGPPGRPSYPARPYL
jgi:hypothetical protein